jgi:hypothetical protein
MKWPNKAELMTIYEKVITRIHFYEKYSCAQKTFVPSFEMIVTRVI